MHLKASKRVGKGGLAQLDQAPAVFLALGALLVLASDLAFRVVEPVVDKARFCRAASDIFLMQFRRSG